MTNEEAIMILKAMIDEMILVFDRDRKKALNMAIEALKEQPEHSQNTSSKQPDLETLGVKTGKTCADAISRQDAIDAILADKIDAISLKVMTALGDGRLALTLNDACDRHIRAIEQLPSAKPEQRWIPVSERMPENSTEVLVTRRFLGCKDGSHGWNKHIPPKDYVEIATRNGEDWTAYSDEYKVARNRHTDPIAWMPLPKPYKEESNGKNV